MRDGRREVVTRLSLPNGSSTATPCSTCPHVVTVAARTREVCAAATPWFRSTGTAPAT